VNRNLLVAAIFGQFLAAGSAVAQVDPNCRDDPSGGPCVEARVRRIREPYGVPSIEEHRAAGDQVRRIFYVGSTGYNRLFIAFVRPRGGDPIVSVHFPRRAGGQAEPPLQTALPWAVWQDVLFRSAYFDRDLAALPSRGGSRSICLDGGTYLVEATDPPLSREEPPTLRRAIGHDCEDGLAKQYAAEVERAALPLFPHCARLDPRQYPSPILQLEACRSLRGDRMAAAEVLNDAEAFRAISGSWDAARLARIFSERSRIDWNGERNEGGGAAAFWAAHATPAISVTNISYESIEGESADRVRLTGTLSRFVETRRAGVTAIETARVEQIWVRYLGAFRVESATVGPWEPYPPRRAATTGSSGDPDRR
jgi:hypothetical protein